jgi:hypothetical protein
VKSEKVAIYGHYDSRGGAMAIRLPENATQEDLERAHREYDEQFGWGEEEGKATFAGIGRAVDVMAHNLIYPNRAGRARTLIYRTNARRK